MKLETIYSTVLFEETFLKSFLISLDYLAPHCGKYGFYLTMISRNQKTNHHVIKIYRFTRSWITAREILVPENNTRS